MILTTTSHVEGMRIRPIEVAGGLGANAVIGVDVDYEVISKRGSMLLVSISGTAVTIEPAIQADATLHG